MAAKSSRPFTSGRWATSLISSRRSAFALHGDSTSKGLLQSDARAKHIIIITDDDPSLPTESTIQECLKNHITISTITIYPHQAGNILYGIRDLAKRSKAGIPTAPSNPIPNSFHKSSSKKQPS